MLERPKLLPHRPAITAALAGALGVGEDAVNVKATTGEGMGFVGREEGAAALAVATLARWNGRDGLPRPWSDRQGPHVGFRGYDLVDAEGEKIGKLVDM